MITNVIEGDIKKRELEEEAGNGRPMTRPLRSLGSRRRQGRS
jgi:hypothetical protein